MEPVNRVHGEFLGTKRRPFAIARVHLPRLGVFTDVSLLVDTGADDTSIHWLDRQRMRDVDGAPLPPNAAFSDSGTASGISGASVACGIEDAEFYFLTEDRRVQIEVAPARIALDNRSERVPSLLGRDLLSAVRLDFDMPTDRLILEWRT